MPQYGQVQPGQLFPGQLYSQSLPAGRTPYLGSPSHTLPPPNRPPGQVTTPAASLYGSHYRPNVHLPSRPPSHSSPASIYGNHVTQSTYAPPLARPPLDSRPASSFTPTLPPLLTPPVASSDYRRWSDYTGSPAIKSPPSPYSEGPIPYSRLSPSAPRMPPPPSPLPQPPYSSPSTTPVHRLPPYPMSPSSPAGLSAPSPLEELGKGEEEELARVLEMSRLLHEEEVRSRTTSHQGGEVGGLTNGAGNAGEDEDLARALEESLATARARTPSTISPSDKEIQTGFLVARPRSGHVVPRPQPSPGAVSPMDLSPPWQDPSANVPPAPLAPSNPSRRTTSYVSPTDSHRITQHPPHSSSLPTAPTSNSSFYNAGVQQSSSAGPPSSLAPQRRPTGGSFVIRETDEDPSGLLSDSLASATPDEERSSTFTHLSDGSREVQPAAPMGSLQGVSQQDGIDGGLIWGHTSFQPPSLAPAYVLFGVSLPHHSIGSLYVIAPCYSALLTGLFAIANVLIEGGEETRLAVQFVRMSSDDDEAITILWIESGRLDVPPQEPGADDRPALRVRTSTGSSASSASSRSLSSQSILRKSHRKPSVHRAQPPAEEVEVVNIKGLQPPTGIYTSSSLIFQHPSFLSYNARAPDRPGPERRSSLVALPSPTTTLLSVSDLLAHLLSLTPSALADVLSLTSAARHSSASNYSSSSDSGWSKKERDRFLTLVADHTPEEADLATLNDDDERTGESAGAKSKTDGEKSKRRWIKEHLVGGKSSSSDGATGQQKKHPLVRLSKEKKDQVAEAAAFITPFSFPTDPHT